LPLGPRPHPEAPKLNSSEMRVKGQCGEGWGTFQFRLRPGSGSWGERAGGVGRARQLSAWRDSAKMNLMLNFRQFEAGPDPFGRKYQAMFKWLQTAISLRHSDTIDVKFILAAEDGSRTEKTIAIPDADLRRASAEVSRPIDDAWCARLAQAHLLHLIETGEDMEKDLITVALADLQTYAAGLARQEAAEIGAR
jgi:hypothetical protein